MSKETLEEFALEQSLKIYGDYDTEGIQSFARAFIKIGAKWQAERMYSKEESIQKIIDYVDFQFNTKGELNLEIKKWFEQFKKK